MTKEEELYLTIGKELQGAEQSQMFGKPCFKINGKAFVCFFQQCMVFKLTGDTYAEALSLEGTQLFDPSGKNRPMKEWVQIPFKYADEWDTYAIAACEYVRQKT
jgi:urate oxidase